MSEWLNGTWYNGTWYNGTWYNGTRLWWYNETTTALESTTITTTLKRPAQQLIDVNAISNFIGVLIIFGCVIFCCCCVCFVFMCYKMDKTQQQLKLLTAKLQTKYPLPIPTSTKELPGCPKQNEPGPGVHKLTTNSIHDVFAGVEGSADAIVVGMEGEGHTSITNRSAVHLEINQAGNANHVNVENKNDDNKEEVVILDSMLSDVMKMQSLDPNKIVFENANGVGNKNDNDTCTDSEDTEDTDDMYQDKENDEKEMLMQDNDEQSGKEDINPDADNSNEGNQKQGKGDGEVVMENASNDSNDMYDTYSNN